LFSATVLVGYRWLDALWWAAVLTTLAIVHLVVVARQRDTSRAGFLASQLVVAVTSLGAIVLYLMNATSPTEHLGHVLRDFVLASLTSPRTYRGFAFHLFVFGALALSSVLLLRVARVARGWDRAMLTRYLCALSAVNIACDYSWRRPLFLVQGEPAAQDFFFSAGLFGVEFTLPIFVILAVLTGTLGGRRRSPSGDEPAALDSARF